MAILAVIGNGVRWRVFEHEMLNKHFGPVIETKTENAYEVFKRCEKDINAIFWKPETEEMMEKNHLDMINQYIKIPSAIFKINDPFCFVPAICKNIAFNIWKKNNISCPEWASVKDIDFVLNSKIMPIDFPLLVRLNNKTGGKESILTNNIDETKKACLDLNNHIKSDSLYTRILLIKFYETCNDNFFVRSSYRIIVAGNKIITAYARLCRPPEWIAITSGGKFDIGMWGAFKYYQKHCEKICRNHEKEIVRAVKVLGLNFQGIDVIEVDGKLIFLEVQPGFSAGYSDPVSGFRPPYYNPSYPPLVNLIKEYKNELPDMYRLWLDKERMFDECFKTLREEYENHRKSAT